VSTCKGVTVRSANFALLILSAILVPTVHAQDEEGGWPRKFNESSLEFTVYQPQVENWSGTQLEERVAVSVQSASAAEPTFGVAWLSGRTDVDKSQRLVALEDIQVTKVTFPTESTEQSSKLKEALQHNVQSVLGTISLDRLRASLAISQVAMRHQAVDVKNDPPDIIYSETPATLVLVDGDPVLRDSGQQGLMRVVNTRALLLMNSQDSQYYVSVANHWYKSSKLSGPWQVSDPEKSLAVRLGAVKSGAETDNPEASGPPPAVYVSGRSAELIQTQGAPKFEPIANTELLYVTNTPDNIFMSTADQGYYVTLSGRWFRSNSIKGPWRFVPAEKLPADFSKIPESHPKGEVLASIPGTAEAKEAVIANEIPQTATVERATAHLNVAYDGAPQFKAIESSRLQYAVNTSTPVIRDSNGAYYAVENGVWFSSPEPQGPWVVVASVPEDIYAIPPSSPVYNVTYVYVYGADPRFVYCGYLPGYLGSFVTPSGVVVYGTGYYYHPWVNHYWYGHPVTYGYGLAWGFGFGWAFRPVFFGAPVYHPWWGPWPGYWAHAPHPWAHQGMTVNHVNVYHNWTGAVIHPSPARIYRSAGPIATHNNVYADHSGNVYRNNEKGWEKYSGSNKTWQQHPATATHDLEREHSARVRGETTVHRYNSRPVASKSSRPAPHGHNH
jgi:hypothetical protein